jgi:hypothetical protein
VGGVYNLGTFLIDAATIIAHNHAATRHDDIFPYTSSGRECLI